MKLTSKDLLLISDFAIDKMITLSTHSLYQQDNRMAQTYAFVSAVILYLNSKNMLKEDITVDDNMNPKYEKE